MNLRTVLISRDRPGEPILKYAGNAVYTTKYSVLSFVPKFLFEQFSRYANLFFLFISVIQQIPNVSPVSRWGTVVPLSVILFITALKEIAEDWRRKLADDHANNDTCEVYSRSANCFVPKKWLDICVGDIVRVVDGKEFPADLIMLNSSADEQTCYVETSNIDGETNLKIRQSISLKVEETGLSDLSGIIRCEEPNKRIYELEGVLVVGSQEIPLGPNQILLRGSRLQNTSWIIGIAIYTGHETKIVMNSHTTRIKRSSVENMTNQQVVYLFIVLMATVMVCFAGFLWATKYYAQKLPYLYAHVELDPYNIAKKFFTFVVLMNNLVPISLILTMEIIRVRLGMLIDTDLELYCAETDTPATAKTTSLIEELGQVQYIFSDKTGTLTKNEMILRKVWVGGSIISGLDKPMVFTGKPKLEHLVVMLASCNTAIVKRAEDKSCYYQASSPDEVAIVTAAAKLGVSLVKRRLNELSLLVEYAGSKKSRTFNYKILALFEFDSSRKRMSIVFQDDDGRIWIYCKGADMVIWPRLSETSQDAEMMEKAIFATEEMAKEGLRTLVFAYRQISLEEWSSWEPMWKKSQADVVSRVVSMEKTIEMLERDFILAGITGVEDLLQDKVSETITALHAAGIKMWVLTGDKLETAVNIGHSCGLLSPETSLIHICTQDDISKMKDLAMPTTSLNSAIVIDTQALQTIFESEDLQDIFVDISKSCRTVICFRVTPSQKAKVVEMVQKRLNAVCLAIGDGANDVGMIQAAQVGVGISGREGLQAALSADFAIAQFRFLQRLLLVHGALAYHRISKAAVFCVYKNILLYGCQFWFAFSNLFSGQTLYESWMMGLYNLAFTAAPPIVIGVTEQFVAPPFLLAHPSLYRSGQENIFYNSSTFRFSALNGLWQSLLAFLLALAVMASGMTLVDGREATLFFMGTTIFAGIILTVALKAALLINHWTVVTVLGLLVCPISWALYVIIYDKAAVLFGIPRTFPDLLGMTELLFTSSIFWFTVILIPVVCLLRDFLWKFYQRQFIPRQYHIIQELQYEEKRLARERNSTDSSNVTEIVRSLYESIE